MFYYISSLETPENGEYDLFAKAVKIIGELRAVIYKTWVLHVVFREYDNRVRKNNDAVSR